MRKISVLLLGFLFAVTVNAQEDEARQDTTWKKKYRESYELVNDLVHTKLDIRFDYQKAWANGKV